MTGPAPQHLIDALVDDVNPSQYRNLGKLPQIRTPHLAGKPASNGTYTKYGCRCHDCTRAHRAAGHIDPADEHIQMAYARTGSVAAVMTATGHSYERVRNALKSVAA